MVFAIQMSLGGRIDAAVSAPAIFKPGDCVEIKVKTKAQALCKIESLNLDVTKVLQPKWQYANDKGEAVWKVAVPSQIEAEQLPFVVTVSKSGQEDVGVCVIALK